MRHESNFCFIAFPPRQLNFTESCAFR